MNTDFFVTEEIPYIGTQPHTSQRSIFPCILRRVIDILGCNKFDVYKELQAAFVPPVTNFVFSYDEGLLNPALRAQVAESLTGFKDALNIIATDSPDIEGMWALVPRCRRFTISGSRNHVCIDNHGFWNHKANPTIFINTILDSFLAKTNISEAERLHLLLKGFAIAIHELGHLLHHYIHYPATKDTPETLHASVFSSQLVGRGEGGECVEEIACGGRFSIDIASHRSHGYRLVGHTRKSKTLVVGMDERISKLVALLASPLAIQHPGPPLPPFPCFAHPHHVIALNGPKYRESFPEAPEGLEPGQLGNISIDEVLGSVPESNHTVQQGYGTLPSNSLVKTPPLNAAAQIIPTSRNYGSSVICALPIREFQE